MNRRAQEQVIGPAAGVILFAVSAAIIIIVVVTALSGFQGSFESTICKFNAWMRAATLGNPLFESLLDGVGYLTGGFGGLTATSIAIPLICSPATELPEQDIPYEIGDVIYKLAEESVNCWDQFGLGKWDPLVLSPQGQTFVCFEQTITIQCTADDIKEAWGDALPSEVSSIIDGVCPVPESCALTPNIFNAYLRTNYYSYTGYEKTYANILPEGSPEMYREFGSEYPVCDGSPHTYYVALYFVDSFAFFRGSIGVPLICKNILGSDLDTDRLVLCFQPTIGGGS